jgi:hypothetical protein
MKIKIGREKTIFKPANVDWKYQSSPDSHFGFWRTREQSVFVKRFVRPPTGWNLLEQSLRSPVPNTPTVFGLESDGQYLYMFASKLEGDVFRSILQKNQVGKYFSAPTLSPEDRLKVFMVVYATLRHINEKGYWYPDLDLKNLFIAGSKESYEVFLIDVDSCADSQSPFNPDHVSQTYWEGLVSTYHRLGKKFINRGNPAQPVLVPEGHSLNQSMAILFAWSIQRLGFVPNEMSLFEPLINPKNSFSRWVLRTHEKLAHGEDCWKEIDDFLPQFFKISRARFDSLFEQYSGQKCRWFDVLARKLLRAI